MRWSQRRGKVSNISKSSAMSAYDIWLTMADNTGTNQDFLDSLKGVGATGPAGADGTAGTTGAAGVAGEVGARGVAGAAGTGLENKETWVENTTYNPGDYVFHMTSINNATNTMWILQGSQYYSTEPPYNDLTHWIIFQAPKGDNGIQGTRGLVGDAGATGATGATGDAGDAGATGDAGDAGAIGATGDAGDAGAVGSTGDAGDAGATGATGDAGDAGEDRKSVV